MYDLPYNVCVVPVIPVSFVLFVFCMLEVISSFRSLRTGSHVFALLMLFLCVISHTMSSGKSLQLLCIFPFCMLCFVFHQYDVCENYVGSVYVGGYGGLSESFLVVGESPSVLL